MSKIYTRKIKCLGKVVQPGDSFIHPTTLQFTINTTNKPICPTDFHFYKQKPQHYTIFTNGNNTPLELKQYMALPYLNLNIEQILSMYRLDTIDSIIEWVDKMIEDKQHYQYINRILNIWIKSNFDDLLKNNKILVKIYNNIAKAFWDLQLEELDSMIKKWFNNKKYDDFVFDLGQDIKIHYEII
jgi:hypothetical protein